MKEVFFTFDYELFFGPNSGTVENCLIKPTEKLIEISRKTGAKFTFFVDCGFLVKLKSEASKFPKLAGDLEKVSSQLRLLRKEGHSLQLHIHPHWEDSFYDGERWQINSKRYRLHDFSPQDVLSIVQRYTEVLASYTSDVFSYRAGGWCIQPFEQIAKALQDNGVFVDSTVYTGGLLETPTHFFDFRKAPKKSEWRFSADPVSEDPQGSFREIAISSSNISPVFYWRFFLSKLSKKKEYSIYGDGQAIGSATGDKIKLLLFGGVGPVSVDGLRASLLQKQFAKNTEKSLVVIGHPKALSEYSFQAMEKFIRLNKDVEYRGFESGRFSR